MQLMIDIVCLLQASPYTAGVDTYKFSDPCDYFTYGKAKASTLSLSVLVAIEMFNAMNALSEVRPAAVLSLCMFAVFEHGELLSSCIQTWHYTCAKKACLFLWFLRMVAWL